MIKQRPMGAAILLPSQVVLYCRLCRWCYIVAFAGGAILSPLPVGEINKKGIEWL